MESEALSVLLVSHFDEHLISLLRILDHTDWSLYWYAALQDARQALQKHKIDVAICDRDLPDGGWKDLLTAIWSLISPPPLIVTASLADEQFWEDVLSLGVYDVLEKPFQKEEVMQVVSSAARLTKPPAAAQIEGVQPRLEG